MTHLERIVIPELLQHVTHRGRNRAAIFRDADDHRAYRASVVYHANRNRVRIAGYVEMDNHVHFGLIVPSKAALTSFIQRLHSEHARRMNEKYGMSGPVFGGRFYSASVDMDAALEVVRYIELNPQRAGMVARAADYEYSSARAHVLGVRDAIAGELWEPLRSIDNYEEWLRELSSDIGDRWAAIRQLTRRGERITKSLILATAGDVRALTTAQR
ncbi:MAG: transposase [Planctomycetes bacterium]|nr:transposase [Planctomycetota bacterium]MCC7171421.1 transposase [Planctomycetota bacterium]